MNLLLILLLLPVLSDDSASVLLQRGQISCLCGSLRLVRFIQLIDLLDHLLSCVDKLAVLIFVFGLRLLGQKIWIFIVCYGIALLLGESKSTLAAMLLLRVMFDLVLASLGSFLWGDAAWFLFFGLCWGGNLLYWRGGLWAFGLTNHDFILRHCLLNSISLDHQLWILLAHFAFFSNSSSQLGRHWNTSVWRGVR